MPATTIAPRPLYWSFPGAETLFEVCTIRISPRVRGTDRQLVRVLAARGEDLVGHPSWALGSVDTVVQVEVVVGLFDDAVAVGPALGAVEVAEQPRDRIAPQTRRLPSRCWRVSSGISGKLGWRTPGPSRRTGLNATASPRLLVGPRTREASSAAVRVVPRGTTSWRVGRIAGKRHAPVAQQDL